jgi:hypothetical protein
MGFDNDRIRPSSPDLLFADAIFDLSDLEEAIKIGDISDIHERIVFLKETMILYRKSMKKSK